MHITLTHRHFRPGIDPELYSYTTYCSNTRSNWLHFARLKSNLLKESFSEILKDLDSLIPLPHTSPTSSAGSTLLWIDPSRPIRLAGLQSTTMDKG